jgi:hypothetical protein
MHMRRFRRTERVRKQVVGLGGAVGSKGLALTTFVHANGVAQHFMHQRPTEEVGGTLLLTGLEAPPHHERVNLDHPDEHMKLPYPPWVGLPCVFQARCPPSLAFVHVNGVEVSPLDRVDYPVF